MAENFHVIRIPTRQPVHIQIWSTLCGMIAPALDKLRIVGEELGWDLEPEVKNSILMARFTHPASAVTREVNIHVSCALLDPTSMSFRWKASVFGPRADVKTDWRPVRDQACPWDAGTFDDMQWNSTYMGLSGNMLGYFQLFYEYPLAGHDVVALSQATSGSFGLSRQVGLWFRNVVPARVRDEFPGETSWSTLRLQLRLADGEYDTQMRTTGPLKYATPYWADRPRKPYQTPKVSDPPGSWRLAVQLQSPKYLVFMAFPPT